MNVISLCNLGLRLQISVSYYQYHNIERRMKTYEKNVTGRI